MDKEFEHLTASVLECSAPKPGTEAPDEEWESRVKRYLRLVYRAGTRGGLNYRYGELTEAVERVRWLADHDFVNADVKALLAEVERRQDEENALQGSYGVTDADIRSMLAEGFHTAFRKAIDHPYATVIHKLITDLPGEEWSAILDFVAEPLTAMLRQAQAASDNQGKDTA